MNANELPPEILSMIFNLLSVREKFNCIRVCRRWKAIILNLKLRNLVIAQDHLPVNESWSFTYEKVDCSSSIINLNLNLIESQLKREVFSSLKQLYIYTISLSYLSASFVETLSKLELLERLEVPLVLLKSKTTLDLQCLKTLSIKQVHGGQLILKTPTLSKLRVQTACVQNFELIYPEMITHLECGEFAYNINSLVNLESLFCLSIIDLNEDFLLNLIKLKEIHFEHDHITFYNLLNQKRLFNRPDLNVFYQGLNNLEYLESNLNYGSNALNEDNIRIYLKNYANVADHLIFINYINYNCWETVEEIDNQFIPPDFISKFVNLDAVLITEQIRNEFRLIDFLNSCFSFSFLKLNNSSLRDEFFAQLPLLCPTLRNLEIKDEPDRIDKLSFNFVFRLPYLTTISTNKRVTVEFVYQAFKELRYLSNFSFKKDDEIEVNVQYFTNLFEVCLNKEICFFDTLDDLYNSLKEFDF